MTLKELMQQRAALAAEMRSLHDSVGEGAMTGEQRSKWEEMRGKLATLDDSIKREQEMRDLDQSFVEENEEQLRGQQQRDNGNRSEDEQRAAAFDAFVRRGLGELSPEERQVLNEMRAQSAAQGDKGGYTVPTTLLNKVFEKMKAYGGLASVSQLLLTDSGNVIDLTELLKRSLKAGTKPAGAGASKTAAKRPAAKKAASKRLAAKKAAAARKAA